MVAVGLVKGLRCLIPYLRRYPGVRAIGLRAAPADQSGDVGAMSVIVVRRRRDSPTGEVVERFDACAEIGRGINARVDHCDGHAGSLRQFGVEFRIEAERRTKHIRCPARGNLMTFHRRIERNRRHERPAFECRDGRERQFDRERVDESVLGLDCVLGHAAQMVAKRVALTGGCAYDDADPAGPSALQEIVNRGVVLAALAGG